MTEPIFSCRVYGVPIGQGRPRAFIPKGWTRPMVHDPDDSFDWKRTVQAQALAKKPPTPVECPLSVRLIFIVLRPKSVKRTWPATRPDVENMSKAVCDALSGVVYRDDVQIVELYLRKEYGEQPGVDIEIRAMVAPADYKPSVPAAAQGDLL